MLEKYKEKIGSSFDIYDDHAYKDNLVKLEVYYEEFNFESINEVPSYKVRYDVKALLIMAAFVRVYFVWGERGVGTPQTTILLAESL